MRCFFSQKCFSVKKKRSFLRQKHFDEKNRCIFCDKNFRMRKMRCFFLQKCFSVKKNGYFLRQKLSDEEKRSRYEVQKDFC